MNDFPKEVLRKENESIEQYKYRLCRDKKLYKLTWDEIAGLVSDACDFTRSEAYYRRWFRDVSSDELEKADDLSFDKSEDVCYNEIDDKIVELQKQKMKLSDERVQYNAILRRLSREETLKEIAKECTKDLPKFNLNDIFFVDRNKIDESSAKKAILCLSDWHYGIEIDLFNNAYNREIAKERLDKLFNKVIALIVENNVNELYVLNLGDLICGRIHLTLRLQSRIDTITQTMEVCELLSNFLFKLSHLVKIHYYDCLDNHSRVEPNKKDSLDLESFARLIPWWLKERLKDRIDENKVIIHDNEYDSETITFNCNGFRVAGVHGHEFKPIQIVDNLSLYIHESFDLVLTAHMHHFSCEEKNETIVVCNGSLMGTDDYARKLHLSSTPSQNLIVVANDNVIDSIHRIITR